MATRRATHSIGTIAQLLARNSVSLTPLTKLVSIPSLYSLIEKRIHTEVLKVLKDMGGGLVGDGSLPLEVILSSCVESSQLVLRADKNKVLNVSIYFQ